MVTTEENTPELKVYEGHCYEDAKPASWHPNKLELTINGKTFEDIADQLVDLAITFREKKHAAEAVGAGTSMSYHYKLTLA